MCVGLSIMSVVADWTTRAQGGFAEYVRTETGLSWPTRHFVTIYGDMWLFKEALEIAGRADREAVANALRTIDLNDGPVNYFGGNRIRFEPGWRRIGASLLIVRWQNGILVTVDPAKEAISGSIWPKR